MSEFARLYSSNVVSSYTLLYSEESLSDLCALPSSGFTPFTCHAGVLPAEGAAPLKLILIHKNLPLLNLV